MAKSNQFYIIRKFGYGRSDEMHIIGPFDERRIASLYEKFYGKTARPHTMYDFVRTRPRVCAESKVPTKEQEKSNCTYYRYTPCEMSLYDVLDELKEKDAKKNKK